MSTKITSDVLKQISLLHAEGLNDWQIADKLKIGKSTVGAALAGQRIVNHKPKQQQTADGRIVCSICKEPKHPNDFCTPKSNGRALSKPSFCKSCQRGKTIKRLSDPVVFLRKRVNDTASRVKKQGVIFTLTVEEVLKIYEEQQGRCFYTDEPMTLSVRSSHQLRHTLSFDRVVPSLGYIASNVVLCTYKANAVKQDLTLTELQNWIPGWHARLMKCSRLNFEGVSDDAQQFDGCQSAITAH